MSTRGEQRKLILWGIAWSLGGVIALYGLFVLRTALLAIYISLLLTIGLSPAVRWLEKGRIVAEGRRKGQLPRWAAILVLYVAFLAAVAGLMAVVIPPLVSQVSELSTKMPEYNANLRDLLAKYHLGSGANLDTIMEKASSSVLGALESMFGAIGLIVTIILMPYYLLVEADTIEAGFLQLVHTDQRPALARVARDVGKKVSAWMGGQMLLCLTIACTATFGLWMLKVPFFYVLGLLAGMGELVPIIGPLITAIPAILFGATVSLKTALFVMAYFSVQQLFEGSVLVPKIMERQVGVSPVTVILALLIGGELLGFIGALLAVPTAAIIQIFIRELLSDPPPPSAASKER
jgi:predicted PurR-regulated permease PerM